MELLRYLNLLDTELRASLRTYFDLLDDVAFERFQLKVIRAFLKELARVLVEVLLDAVAEAHAERPGEKEKSPARRVSDALLWKDPSSYYKARKTGSLSCDKLALILVRYGRWVRFDPVYAEKRGYLASVQLCAKRSGEPKGKVTMAELDALFRIFMSEAPTVEAQKEPAAQRWVRPFLLAMTILAEEYPEMPEPGR